MAPSGARAALPAFERRVYPFPVHDEQGIAYAHPFLGGYNIPRPQWIDVDGDGDLDLFVQESSGEVAFFEALSDTSPAARLPLYRWRTDRFRGLRVGEWYRFADMDHDGDWDLLAETPFSYLRLYRNDGPPESPAFTLAADTLRDTAGRALFSDRQNIPNVADIDCDGLLDLLIGRLTGTISRYEEAGKDATGAARFRFLTDHFENIEIIGQMRSRHGANTLALADVDEDGDPDLLWGDFFEPGLLLIENTGSCERPSLSGEPLPFPPENPLATSGYNAPTFGDVDRDGDLDLLVGVIGGAFDPNRTTVENLYFLEQGAGGRFEERTRRFLTQVDVGSESLPALADLDADGDLDLLLSNKIEPGDRQTSRIYKFANEGTAREPVFRLVGPLPMEGSYHYAPALGDLDADGDLDMLLGSWRAKIAYWRNDGARTRPRFVLADSALVRITRGSNTTPALVDIDADGDLDLFVGESSGALNFYRNEGTPRAPRFVLVSDEYGEIDPGRRTVPSFVDLDGDGDADLLLGTESSGVLLYRNEGGPAEPSFALQGPLAVRAPGLAAPAFGDVDGDGDPDLFLGGVGGGLLFYEANPGR
ncbi:MAG: FG-GAP repeat domain-containing protein [Gemmatimonadota bacterium]